HQDQSVPKMEVDSKPLETQPPPTRKGKKGRRKNKRHPTPAENVEEMETCFRCTAETDQFVSFENASELTLQVDVSSLKTASQDDGVFLFSPSDEMYDELKVDAAVVDVSKEGRFKIPVLNTSRARVYLDQGRVVGTLVHVKGALPLEEYLVKQRASESDGETGITVAAATAANDDRDRFHLEITDPAERRRLLLQQLCFDDECNEDEKRRIAELCCKYTYTFAVTELELGRCNFMEAAIET
ncbi:MAG: hypothetical protein GY737_04855, partial [Desulfobacteraceae bacterium]|nr:hypothetical protein [Desulfobacteraceae bacterium]